MESKVLLGKIVNTHGIKGELRILSDFEKKDLAFKIGNELIINNYAYTVASYRKHKKFDMVTFEGYNDINSVLFLKGQKVFISRKYFDNDFLLSDYIGLNVISDGVNYGVIKDYENGLNPLLIVTYKNKNYYIPLKGNFIEKVEGNSLIVKNVKELIL